MGNLYIFGAGGIGLLLTYLIGKKNKITLIARESTRTVFETNQLSISGALEDSIPCTCKTIGEVTSFENGDYVFLTTKANDTFDLVKKISAKFENGANLVLCQNGIGIYEEACKRYPKVNFLRLNCWMGARRTSLDKVLLAGTFKFDLSAHKGLESELRAIEAVLKETGIRVDSGFDPVLSEWQKALWNIAVNGLCSIVDSKNGAILDYQELKGISESLLSETKEVANSGGIEITDNDIRSVFDSLEKTRSNINATLQDLRAGKPHEIDYLNGAVVRCAKKFDQKAPLNETIVNLVNYLEKSEARRILDK